jgi:hypothetical protein
MPIEHLLPDGCCPVQTTAAPFRRLPPRPDGCTRSSGTGANIIFIEKRISCPASCYEVTFVKVKIRHPTNFLPDDHICLHFQLLEGALI